jgi:uncharacterized cupredoxin-like copper-binding protein
MRAIPALLVAAASAVTAHGALAHGGEAHAVTRHHDPSHAEAMAFGRAGDPARVTRTVKVSMSDAMRFAPSELVVTRGDTVRFVVRNDGKVLHELVLGTDAELRRHAELMRRFPGMEHDEAHMVHVKPGEQGELVWTFDTPGEFGFACLIPGHFEAGMKGKVVVK